MLSCPIPAGGSTAGAPCCRLTTSHQLLRRTRRYPSDVTDASGPNWTRCYLIRRVWPVGRGGRWEKHCRRVIVDAILYVVDNGRCREPVSFTALGRHRSRRRHGPPHVVRAPPARATAAADGGPADPLATNGWS